MSGVPRTDTRIRAWLGPLSMAVLLALGTIGPVHAEGEEVGTEPVDAVPKRHRDAEVLALDLLNCTRSGGWVRADGTCKGGDTGRYSRPLEPLRLHRRISRYVAFQWASELVLASVCDHVIPGKPELGARFSAAGFSYPRFGENVGCAWGSKSPAEMVLWAHRSMQAEKRTKGWHWRNMKNPDFQSVGIGVASIDGRTTVVYDFYGRPYGS